MQTFLPYEDYEESAKSLDYRRLGKQRVETYQLLKVLADQAVGKGWKNHPAGLMWKGVEYELIIYGENICREWMINRGYRDNTLEKINEFKNIFKPTYKPFWLGLKEFHDSHKSNLVRKDPIYYQKFLNDSNVNADNPYIWPIKRVEDKYMMDELLLKNHKSLIEASEQYRYLI